MDQDSDLGRQLKEIYEKLPDPLPSENEPIAMTREIALNIVKEHVTQGRAHLSVDPETNATKTLIYCVPGDESPQVKLKNKNYENHQKETLHRLSFKNVSHPFRTKRDLVLTRVMAIRASDPTVSDLVSKAIPYKDFVSQNPQFNYNNWDKLIDAGLTKAHVIRDEWIEVDSLVALCGSYRDLFPKLVEDLGFSANDLLCTSVFGNGAAVLLMGVTHKHLSEIGLTKKILLSEDCSIDLRSMVLKLKLGLGVLEKQYGFSASSFKTMIDLGRMNGWEEFKTLFKEDHRTHFGKGKQRNINCQTSPSVPLLPLTPPSPQTATVQPVAVASNKQTRKNTKHPRGVARTPKNPLQTLDLVY